LFLLGCKRLQRVYPPPPPMFTIPIEDKERKYCYDKN